MAEKKSLRILFVEDLPTDTEIAVREFSKTGLQFTFMRVETRDEFLKALEKYKPDIIISDYLLPEFDGMQALKLSLQHDAFIPFIILTGSMNEDTAVICLKTGATDYVIKEHITRLPFAVKDAIEKVKVLKEKGEAIEQLRESEERYKSLFNNNHAVMLLINPENSLIIDANPAACRYYGWSYEELLNKKISEITENSGLNSQNYTDNIQGYYILKNRLSDGQIRDVEIYCGPMKLKGKNLNYCIIHDITDRKQAEEKVKQNFKEKESLLKELYHRTKNNMQVIIALLSLQAENSHDETLKRIIRETTNRIQSMALVHQKLYQSKDLSLINLKDYFIELIDLLIQSYRVLTSQIKINLEMEPVYVLIDTAIPCGLIMNELISNSFKHAFPENRNGEILVKLLHSKDDTIEIHVSDNGVGVPEDFDFTGKESLGLKIINSITEHQLQGRVRFKSDNGIKCCISLPNMQHRSRV